MSRSAVLATGLLLCLPLLPLEPAMADVAVDRGFGFFIGDIAEARAELTLPAGARLVDGSLPRAGRISPWLNLLSVDVARDGPILRITRRYQFTASGEQVRLLYLPPAEIRYRQDDVERSERLPAIPVTVSPLSNRKPVTRAGLGDLRPDRPAPLPSLEGIDQALRLAVAALIAAVALAAGLRWRARRLAAFAPFRKAAVIIGRHRRRATGSADVDAGYRALHRAFDQAAGRTVFVGDVEAFLRDHPRFLPERERIVAFFDRSAARFFAGGAGGASGASDAGSANGDGPAGQLRGLADLSARLTRHDRGTRA